MKQTMLNTPEDMDWLISVHMGNRKELKYFQSAVLYGNEDCPEKVELYADVDPLITDIPHVVNFI